MRVPNVLYKLIISYDGTRYFGWQKTKSGPTIQEELQKAVAKITQENTIPEAASRTDRGVHALGQVVHLSLQKEIALSSLNAVLPYDIRVLELEPASFHATLDAVKKEYHYHLCFCDVQDPVHRLYSWHTRYPLDLEKMRRASKDLLGAHDFSAFANEKEENPYCTLELIQIEELPGQRLQISLIGNRFLYKMARNLSGTLVYIGCGKLQIDCIPSLLASRDRKAAGITAPAHGLVLQKVFYDTNFLRYNGSHDYTK